MQEAKETRRSCLERICAEKKKQADVDYLEWSLCRCLHNRRWLRQRLPLTGFILFPFFWNSPNILSGGCEEYTKGPSASSFLDHFLE